MPVSGGTPVPYQNADALHRAYPAVDPETQFGYVELDSADGPADVWPVSNGESIVKTWPVTAQPLYISSSSASDTAVTLTIQYLDADGNLGWLEHTHTGGQTPTVVPGITVLDVSRVANTGAIQEVGDLYFHTATAHTLGVPDDTATILAMILAGHGRTMQSSFKVPTGYYARIHAIEICSNRSGGTAGSISIHCVVKHPGQAEWVVRQFEFAGGDINQIEAHGIGRLPAGAYFVMRVVAVSHNSTRVSANLTFDILPL